MMLYLFIHFILRTKLGVFFSLTHLQDKQHTCRIEHIGTIRALSLVDESLSKGTLAVPLAEEYGYS